MTPFLSGLVPTSFQQEEKVEQTTEAINPAIQGVMW